MIIRARIFQKGKKVFKLWRSTPVFFLSSIILIILCTLLSQNIFNDRINEFLKIICYGLIAVPLITLGWGMGELELLNGKISGQIEFTPTHINIQEQTFHFKELDQITFVIQSYYEEKVNIVRYSGPALSQGVNNNISFKYKGAQYSYAFQLTSERHLHIMKKYINDLRASGLILEYYYKGQTQ
jgi:hypothetical protein